LAGAFLRGWSGSLPLFTVRIGRLDRGLKFG
jgi:hypothetical protein